MLKVRLYCKTTITHPRPAPHESRVRRGYVDYGTRGCRQSILVFEELGVCQQPAWDLTKNLILYDVSACDTRIASADLYLGG